MWPSISRLTLRVSLTLAPSVKKHSGYEIPLANTNTDFTNKNKGFFLFPGPGNRNENIFREITNSNHKSFQNPELKGHSQETPT